MNIDEKKSLAQLTGADWGKAPEGVGVVVRERHEYRQTPLKDLSLEGLRRLLALDFQDDRAFLIPYSLARVEAAMAAAGPSPQYCNLLLEVLSNDGYDWLQKPALVRQTRQLVDQACYELYLAIDDAEQTDDSSEYYRVMIAKTQVQASLYEKLALFERRISRVEPKEQ